MKKKAAILVIYLLVYFGIFPLRIFALTTPPTDSIDTLSYVLLNGKLREIVIKNDTVWWRESPDSTETKLPAIWSFKLLSEAWPSAVSPADHPIPTSGINVHSYQRFPGCGTYGNRITEIVIKGGELWYRRSMDINGTNIGSVPFTYTTLAQTWGTSGPPADSINTLDYDIYDGNPRELVFEGSNVWIRTLDCNSSQWSTWRVQSLTQSWSTNTNYPPITGDFDVFSTNYAATDNVLEIVVKGNSVWSRRSYDTNSHHASDVWRLSSLSNFWQRNYVSLSNSEIASLLIDKFMSIYGNTDFSLIFSSTDKNVIQNNVRALLAQALAYSVKYRLSNNTVTTYLTKTKNIINTTILKYNLWGKSTFSGEATRNLLLTSWLVWDQLSDQEKSSLESLTKQEADYWVTKLTEAQAGGPFLAEINGYIDDTKAETNGCIAEGMAFAANLFPESPSANVWNKAALCFAFHTITTSTENTDCNITTQTVYDDYTLDNHNYHPSVLYTLAAIAPLNQGTLGYYLNGIILPSEFRHNVPQLWDKFFTFFHHGDYTIYPQYFRGQDWGDIDVWLAMTDINFLLLIDNSSHLTTSDITRMAYDIVHYFYSINKDTLRFSEPSPIVRMPTSGSATTNWFLNTLTHAKGASEIIIYSNPQLFFCRGNVDIRGKSTHLCNSSIPLKPFPSPPSDPSPSPTIPATPLPGDLNGDGHVDLFDYNRLVTYFGTPYTIYDYNTIVMNFGK